MSIAYEKDLMTCTGSDFNWMHRVETLYGPVHLSTANAFSITCKKRGRIAPDGKSKYYPRTTLTIAAGGVSPLAVVFPSETLNGFELASQAQATVNQALNAYNQANKEADDERMAAVALQQRLSNVSGQIVVHRFGDGTPWGCGPSRHDWGGDTIKEAQAVCGVNKYVTGSNDVHSGGSCGYGVTGFACIVVPH